METVENKVHTDKGALVPIASHRMLTRVLDFLDFAKSKEWKEKVSAILDDRKKLWKAEKKFFGDDIRTTPEERAISWRAFPKRLQESGEGRWAQADKREAQDEYCEWNVERNADKKIVKVTFTAEMHEVYLSYNLLPLSVENHAEL